MACDAITDLLELYAAGALEGEERAQVERHLETCATCRRAAAELLEVVGMLPQALAAAAPVTVPPAVRERLMHAVAQEAAPGHGFAATPMEPRPAPPPAPAALPPPAWSWLRLRSLGLAAALIALALALAWGVQLNAALAQERALRAEFARLVNQQQELVIEVIDSNQTQRAVLRSPQAGSTAYGKLFTRPDLPHVVVMAARLPDPPPGQAYHVWLRRDGRMDLAGVLKVDRGFGVLVFDADRAGPVYQAAQIILQLEGAAQSLGGMPILVWQASG
jgi:hypothetical protein